MEVKLLRIADIKPYPGNPRVNDAAVDAVATSIKEYGFKQPIVVDRDMVIVIGHTRLKAAKRLGLQEVPVVVAHDLSPEKVRALRIADNATGAIAEWDMELLKIELSELQLVDYDLGLLGLDAGELAKAMGTEDKAGECDRDDVPEPPAVATTQPGDIWLLGEHKLLCGDSTKQEDVLRLMAGQKAALAASDPPYLVSYTGERPNDSGKDWRASYREIDITDADGFFRSVFTNVLEVLAPHSAIYCWHAHKRQALISRVWEDLSILDHQQIVWVKPTPVFGRVFWHFRHEPCMMGWLKGSQPNHDGDQAFNSVWEIDWEGKSRIVGNEHPTQKPVEIFARPIRKHTQPGDICFEPFSGSGSQLIAAEQLGRRCYAIEISPIFVDVAVKRWEQFTGQKAERVAAGTTAVASPGKRRRSGSPSRSAT